MSNLRSLRRISVVVIALLASLAPVHGQQQSGVSAEDSVQTPAAAQQPTMRLSMTQAVDMALQTNLGLVASRLNLQTADLGIAQARANFLPTLSFNVQRNSTENQPISNSDGTSQVSSSTQVGGGGSFRQALPWYGSNYTVQWNSGRFESSGFATFNPRLSSSFSFNFTQPLLRNFKTDGARANVEASERNRVVVDLQLEQQVVRTEDFVRNAYLNLLAAIEGLKVAQENLGVTERSLQQARSRVEVGVAPEIEIIQADAQVEGQRNQVIQAEAAVGDAKDALRVLILDPARPDYWTIDFDATDTVELTQPSVDLDATVRDAIQNRIDLQVLRRNIEISDVSIAAADNATKTQLDVFVNYSASASGGTQQLGGGATSVRSFGSVLSDSLTGAFPSWTVGVQASYPLGQSQAKANLAQQQVQKRQSVLNLQQAELQVTQQVRSAVRRVESSYQSVLALQANRGATERQLDAEQRRFAVGLSDSFTLQQREVQLFVAKTSELNAIINYNRALIALERVKRTQ